MVAWHRAACRWGGSLRSWLQEVSVEDRHGQKLAQVETVRTESTLLSLLLNSQELGVIHIDKPALTVVLRDDGSNLEDALASLLAKPSSSGMVSGSIEVTDGSVNVVDMQADAHRAAHIDWRDHQLPSAAEAQGAVTLDRCQHHDRVPVG